MAWYDPSLIIAEYQLKYYWTSIDQHGTPMRLNIYERTDETLTPVKIGGVNLLNLEVQGGQDGITAPLVKTNLTIGLVDAPEESTVDTKWGGWEEFFTPDSTLYLVELLRAPSNAVPSSSIENYPYWRGYITPDSWKESLDYRGSIEIVARDNLGHLQDFAYDDWGSSADLGTRKISHCFMDALNLIHFPMTVELPWNSSDDGALWLQDDNTYLFDAYFFTEPLREKSWLDVIESLMDATGHVLRFYGDAEYSITPIRNLPLRNKTSRSAALARTLDVEFYGGTRTLDPAYKSLTDTIKYEGSKKLEQDISWRFSCGDHIETYSGTFYDTEDRRTKTFTGRSIRQNHNNSGTEGWTYGMGYWNNNIGTPQASLVNEDGEDALQDCIMLATNMSDPVDRGCKMLCFSTDVVIHLEFDKPVELKTDSSPYTFARAKGDYVKEIEMAIRYIAPNERTYYWSKASNAWLLGSEVFETYTVADAASETYSLDIILEELQNTYSAVLQGGYLEIVFRNIILEGPDTPDYGAFARLTSIVIEQRVARRAKSDTVTTVNNENYNVLVEREPLIGALSVGVPYFSPKSYENILWKYNASGVLKPFGYEPFWDGESDSDGIPLPGQIHKQLLCFNHEALSILEGDFGPVAKSAAICHDYEFAYKGKRYLLQSGTLDLLTGRMRSAILREYIWWGDLW